MIYVMSDIHGCYREYMKALDLIQFSDEDELYVIGDVVDRGEDGIKILQDMMMRANVIPIIGNHEYMALTVLRRLSKEITEETAENYLTLEDMTSYFHWISDGGDKTATAFRKLNREMQAEILEYLEDFSLYEEVHVGGRDYVLVHAGLEPFAEGKALEDYTLAEMIFKAPDYERVYFADKYLVTGHRPTLALEGEACGKVLCKNNHIAIDCGCVFGGKLAVMRLDDGKIWYVEKI